MSSIEITEQLNKSIALVGLMGAGKSTIGRRLAQRLGMQFVDSDNAIEDASGLSIADLYKTYGEDYFRAGERRVISRLIEQTDKPIILSLGGGAFVNAETRSLIKSKLISIWLDADIDILLERVSRKPGKRPLLDGPDPKDVLQNLLTQRAPIYAQADLRVRSDTSSHEATVKKVVLELDKFLRKIAL